MYLKKTANIDYENNSNRSSTSRSERVYFKQNRRTINNDCADDAKSKQSTNSSASVINSQKTISRMFRGRSPTEQGMTTKKSFRINIKQKVPAGQRSHAPVNRTIDPDEIVIVRAKGEGSRPIFDRDNIVVNSEFNSEANYERTGRPKVESSPEPEKSSRNYSGPSTRLERVRSSSSSSVDVSYKHKTRNRSNSYDKSKRHERSRSVSRGRYVSYKQLETRSSRERRNVSRSRERSPHHRQRDKRKPSPEIQKRTERSKRSRSTSRESYHKHGQTSSRRNRSAERVHRKVSKSPPKSSYYVDEQREKDRLREERKRYEKLLREIRLGSGHKSRSPERSRHNRTRQRSRSYRSRSRSRSRERRPRYRSRERSYPERHPVPSYDYAGHYREDLRMYHPPMAPPMMMRPFLPPPPNRMGAPRPPMPRYLTGQHHRPSRGSQQYYQPPPPMYMQPRYPPHYRQ